MALTEPLLPIPNDDPACRCYLPAGQSIPETFILIGFASPDIDVALDPACPEHAPVLKALRGCLTSVSLG